MLLFSKDEDGKFQKIFGSTILLIAGIWSGNAIAISVSVIVGGLLVATEDFMRFIVAVIKSRGDMVPQTVHALIATPATKEEMAESIPEKELIKHDEEVEVVKEPEVISARDGEKRTSSSKNEKVIERYKKTEKLVSNVQEELQMKFGENYYPEMKLQNEYDEKVVVDGVVKRKEKPVMVVEVKYITEKSFPNVKYLVYRFRNKLNKVGFTKALTFVLIADEMNEEYARLIKADVRNAAQLIFYKHTEGALEEIVIK